MAIIEEKETNIIAGRNPIREAIKSGRPIEKILASKGDLSGSAQEIIRSAREAGIIVQETERYRLDKIYPNHQGLIAYASMGEYTPLEDVISAPNPFIVALDGVTDPHNLGAVIRSAAMFGANGVVVPERRSAGLSPSCEKASAGALNYVKISRVVNLTRALREMKERGIWIIGADAGGQELSKIDMRGPICLVIGGEGEGMSRLVREECDFVVSIQTTGVIDSLNASVAAGIIMNRVFELRRSE